MDWFLKGGSSLKDGQGFESGGGYDGRTKGLWAWSELFVVDVPGEGEVAVMLVDTQGTFDTQSNVDECAMIFALSTLISSVQVWHLVLPSFEAIFKRFFFHL